MLILSALWIFLGIQSPFLVFCFYGAIERYSWIAKPEVVVPSVVMVGTVLFLGWNSYLYGMPADTPFYSHFLISAGLLLVSYFFLSRSNYEYTEALVLSLLTTIAIDQLWQVPQDIVNWSAGFHSFAVGISTGAWDFMSIPLIFYFLLKFGKRLKFDWRVTYYGIAACSLSFIFGLTSSSYIVTIPWLFFFLAIFRASK